MAAKLALGMSKSIMHPFTVPSWTHGSDGVHVILNGLRGFPFLRKCVRLAAGSGFFLPLQH